MFVTGEEKKKEEEEDENTTVLEALARNDSAE